MILEDNNIEINNDFEKVIKKITAWESVFLTWKAWTWKSTLLKYIVSTLHTRAVVLAPTWVAAINVWWQTIHSFFWFKPDITYDSIKKTHWSEDPKSIYRNLDTIIIDEISMVRADLLDCVDKFLRINWPNPDLPFSWIQMIFIWDLYQLPPVISKEESEFLKGRYKSQYFFESEAFKLLPMSFIELKKVYRQKDRHFIDLLSRIRNWSHSYDDLAILNSRVSNNDDSNNWICLCSTNKIADEINENELDAIDTLEFNLNWDVKWEFAKDYFPTQLELRLKPWAQVMLLNNDPDWRWANWTIWKVVRIERYFEEDAIVVELEDWSEFEVTKFSWELFKFRIDEDWNIKSDTIWTFTQYPLKLAFAITIHKSQWKTFQEVEIDMGSWAFACWQVYVALSRCTSLEWLKLKRPLKMRDIKTDYMVNEFLKRFAIDNFNKTIPEDKKIEMIRDAINNDKKIRITLKTNKWENEKILKPENICEMEYLWNKFLWIEWTCQESFISSIYNADKMMDLEIL